jgi:predicted solute-binding protein
MYRSGNFVFDAKVFGERKKNRHKENMVNDIEIINRDGVYQSATVRVMFSKRGKKKKKDEDA